MAYVYKKHNNKEGPKAQPTHETRREFAAVVRRGNFRTFAGERLGIPKSTWSAWVTRGKKELAKWDGDGELGRNGMFLLDIDRAEAEYHDTVMTNIMECGDVKVQLDFIKCRWSKRYSKNPNAHEDPDTGDAVKLTGAEVLANKFTELFGDERKD